jgi:hypothetical protein
MTTDLPANLEIAPGYTVGCWKSLALDLDEPNAADWQRAIDLFDARIRRRFFDPVDELIKSDQRRTRQTFGFAILAIDFLVIETLQGFREGVIDHRGKSKCLFTNFLKRWASFTECLPEAGDPDTYASKIYKAYRCALHHSGATDGAFRVGVSGPVFAFETDYEVKINRTCLHNNLKREFDAFVVELRKPDEKLLRCNFRKKMNAICGL